MTEARPSKRERTRRKLIAAGLQIMADRGEALTASDVVAAADVSNGTFYNHFVDREQFIQTLAHETLKTIAEASANETDGADPAWRFAVATTRVLDTASRRPVWGRAVLRLHDSSGALNAAVQQHLRADLAEGYRVGRFAHGDDSITVDLVVGTVMSSIRRLISADAAHDDSSGDAIAGVVARLLEAIGLAGEEAQTLAAEALHRSPTSPG